MSLPKTPSACRGTFRELLVRLERVYSKMPETQGLSSGTTVEHRDGPRDSSRRQTDGERLSCGATFVVVLQTAEVWDLDVRASGWQLCSLWVSNCQFSR